MRKIAVMLLLPLLLAGTAMGAVPSDLTKDIKTFCQAFQAVYENEYLTMVPEEFQGLLQMLLPANADINGHTWVRLKPEPVSYELGSNGMLDCYAELKVLETVLKNPSFSVNGLTHNIAVTAYNTNADKLSVDIGNYWNLFKLLADGLPQILKGFLVLGDGDLIALEREDPLDSTSDPVYVEVTGSTGFIRAIFAVAGEFVTNPNPNFAEYGLLPQYFSPEGDADSDGFSNECEFAYYGPGAPAGSNDKYVANALNPVVHPPTCDTGEGEGEGEGDGEGEGEPTYCQDTDRDQLCDEDEFGIGTAYDDPDSDDDGVFDGLEVTFGSDPLDPNDTVDLPGSHSTGIALLAIGLSLAGLALVIRKSGVKA